MRDQAIGQPDVSSLALAEPTRHVRHRWIVGLTLASLGMWMANQTPLQVMLALQLQDITPRHKIVALGVVTGAGAISSALATPVVGALSDRTAYGRRLGRFSGRASADPCDYEPPGSPSEPSPPSPLPSLPPLPLGSSA